MFPCLKNSAPPTEALEPRYFGRYAKAAKAYFERYIEAEPGASVSEGRNPDPLFKLNDARNSSMR